MYQYTVQSDIGRRREVNEDCAAVLKRPDGLMLAVIADGMGGHNAGDRASRMTVDEIGRLFLAAEAQSFATAALKKSWLSDTVRRINRLVFDFSEANPLCSGMGTTLIAAIIDCEECVLCHVGDSRAYMIGGSVVQITRDHSYVNLLVDNGQLSQAEADDHPKKNLIVKALGTEPELKEDLFHIPLESAAYLLLCSDGLSNKVGIEEMAAIIRSSGPLAQKGEDLLKLANDLGGEDNISFVLLSPKSEVS